MLPGSTGVEAIETVSGTGAVEPLVAFAAAARANAVTASGEGAPRSA